MEIKICKKVCIDCCENDLDDIKLGGPEFIGFDFFIPVEELDEIKEFIIEAFSRLDLPFISMYETSEDYYLSLNEVWNRKRILKCLAMQAEYIKKESKRSL